MGRRADGTGRVVMERTLYQVREKCLNCGMLVYVSKATYNWGETIQRHILRSKVVCESCGCRMDGMVTHGERRPIEPDPDLVVWKWGVRPRGYKRCSA